ncbi:MAG: ABC transporter permease, partial [Saprospiraceae bacterium]|nr:ABC transporter permease [Saprospiraceae bacterium]
MNRKPSKSAIKFLRWFCREDSIEEIEGDLLEIFSKDAIHHPGRAQRHFIYSVIKSFRWRNLKIAHRGVSIISWDLFRHYFKLSLRSIRTNPTFSFLNIMSITIGLTCCLALLTFSRYEDNFDRHYSEFNQIYRIVQHTKYPEKTEFWNTTAYPLAAALRHDFPEAGTVAQTAGPLSYTINIAGNRKTPLRYSEDYVLFADSGYMKLFQPQWLAGIQDDFNSNINCILLTETTARKYFGPDYNPEELLHNEIILIGETPLELVGIVADPPANSTIRYDILIPYSFFRNKNEYWAENWSGNYQGTTFIRLNERTKAEQMNQAINHWKKKYLKPEDDQRIEYFLQPLIEMHTDTRYGSSPGSYVISKKMIRIGRLIAVFILLIAILNFINLVSARSGIRLKEISLRKIVGGSRWKLFQQFFLENTLLVCIAVGLSLLSVQYVLVKINESLSMINLDLKIKQDDIWTIIIVGLSAILLTNIYPASILSSFKPVQLLTKQFGSRIKQSFSRKGFILFQFILIHSFVASAIIIFQQMNFFKNSEIGFSSDQVVITPAPDFSRKDP